jgi:periodic tryptophan protein 1
MSKQNKLNKKENKKKKVEEIKIEEEEEDEEIMDEMKDEEEDDFEEKDDKAIISAIKWVPIGAPLKNPKEQKNYTKEEIKKILSKESKEEEEFENILNQENEYVKSIKEVKKEEEEDEEDDIYDFKNYDNEDLIAVKDFKNSLIYDDDRYDGEEEMDNIKDEEDEESDFDYTIQNGDIELLALSIEDDISTLQVWIYEEKEKNLYLHHDILLSSFGLCIEWIGKDVTKEDSIGNFCAIGSYEPIIEIWDLDLINPIEPILRLGNLKKTGFKTTNSGDTHTGFINN